jgi:hypothetical protein
MAERKRTVVVERKASPDVDRLLRNFDRASDSDKLEFEGVLLDAARKAERDGRIADSIRIKQRLLQLRAGR